MTQPNVSYYCKLRGKSVEEGGLIKIDNPADSPKPELIQGWQECIVKATIITPKEYYKGIKDLVQGRRGILKHEDYMSNGRVISSIYELPLSELITDFFDKMKSLSQGYASLDYEQDRYQDADIVKVIFHLNGDPVDALSFLVHESRLVEFSKGYARKLKDILPAQLFKIAIQAKVGGKVFAREDVKAVRKDVTAKCYGGDISRKRKLLDKQKRGKKLMRMLGTVPVDADVFLKLLNTKI